jgi:hypothetical protein
MCMCVSWGWAIKGYSLLERDKMLCQRIRKQMQWCRMRTRRMLAKVANKMGRQQRKQEKPRWRLGMRVLKLFGATLAPAIPATKVNSAANQAVPADPAPNRQAQWSRWRGLPQPSNLSQPCPLSNMGTLISLRLGYTAELHYLIVFNAWNRDAHSAPNHVCYLASRLGPFLMTLHTRATVAARVPSQCRYPPRPPVTPSQSNTEIDRVAWRFQRKRNTTSNAHLLVHDIPRL